MDIRKLIRNGKPLCGQERIYFGLRNERLTISERIKLLEKLIKIMKKKGCPEADILEAQNDLKKITRGNNATGSK